MELEKFVENFAGQFFDTPAEMIKSNTEFRQLDEWSSMTGLCILSMIKDEYGFFLDPNIFKQCKTVEDVFNAVKAH
ncbi:MAG: acyl carrier protein [Paludibacteraceae bacterium]|nr:acyl carrier protein [Paludibacteraceae bacterium]